MKKDTGKIKDWNSFYKETENKTMPWYSEVLDLDLVNELKKRKLNSGCFLDLGTGPGTQALKLSEMGFKVTGIDVSEAAIEKVKKINNEIDFIQDDILNTKLNKQFEYIFDRGCFHTMEPENREKFVENVYSLLKPGALYFLKCFSIEEISPGGPNRISHEDINHYFGKKFDILSIKDTEFRSKPENPPRKALFVVMRK